MKRVVVEKKCGVKMNSVKGVNLTGLGDLSGLARVRRRCGMASLRGTRTASLRGTKQSLGGTSNSIVRDNAIGMVGNTDVVSGYWNTEYTEYTEFCAGVQIASLGERLSVGDGAKKVAIALLGVILALVGTATAWGVSYNSGDLAAINLMIQNNGLVLTPATQTQIDNGQIPSGWSTSGYMSWSGDGNTENRRITAITIQSASVSGAVDLTALTALSVLEAYNNTITSINLSGLGALQTVHVSLNQLTTLDIRTTGARDVQCDNNLLTTLLLPASLQTLIADGNQLGTVDLSMCTSAVELGLPSCQLTSVKLPNTNTLTKLRLGNNYLTSLDVTQYKNLAQLNIQNNKLTYIDISKSTVAYGSFDFLGDGQTATRTAYSNGAGWQAYVKFYTTPTNLGSTFSYDAKKGLLICTDPTKTSTQFEVTAGKTNKYLRGTVSITYTSNPPRYNIGDIETINRLITENGLTWTVEDMIDLTTLPDDWTGATWTNVAYDKRITNLDIKNSEVTGDADISGLTELLTLDASNNHLTGLDLRHNTNLASFDGTNQTCSLKLYPTAVGGPWEVYVRFVNPTGIAPGLTYDTHARRLRAPDTSIASSPFTTETGKAGWTLSGTLYLDYAASNAVPTYNIGDMMIINRLITRNGLDLTPATASQLATGSGIPTDWESSGITSWSTEVTVNIRDTTLLMGASLQRGGDIAVTGLEKLRRLTWTSANATTLEAAYCDSLREIRAGRGLTALDVTGCSHLQKLFANGTTFTEFDVSTCPQLQTLVIKNHRLTSIDLSQNPLLVNLEIDTGMIVGTLDLRSFMHLTYAMVNNNKLREILLPNSSVLRGILAKNNQLTAVDLSTYDTGTYEFTLQKPSRTLYWNADSNRYDLPISLRNPTTLNSHFKYEYGRLIANDKLCDTTTFKVETGHLASLGPDAGAPLSGVLYITFSDEPYTPDYNPDDIAVINRLIEHNGLGWALASPADGSYCPSDWTGVTWSSDAHNKRITGLDLSGLGLRDTLLLPLPKLESLDVSHNAVEGMDLRGDTSLRALDCSHNALVQLDLGTEVGTLTSFDGSNQTASVRMNPVASGGPWEAYFRYALSGLAAGLSYDSDQRLRSATNTIDSSPFNAETGQKGRMLSGTLNLSYADDPMTYNIGDMMVINSMIANNGLQWTPASAEQLSTGASIPADWGAGWSGDTYNKRVTYLDINGKSLIGAMDVSGLTRMERFFCYNNSLTSLDVHGLTSLWELACETNQLTSLNVKGLSALSLFTCLVNQLTQLDVTTLTSLNELHCDNNKLTALDLTNCPNFDNTFSSGASQTPSVKLYFRPSDGKYGTRIALNNPTGLAAGLRYSNGWLIADDKSNSQTPFSVETGKSGFSVSGTMSLTYDDNPPTYNPDDIAVINSIIANNGLGWTTASPDDGSYCPSDWSGVTWSGDTYNKRIIQLNIVNKGLTGAIDVAPLTELTQLLCGSNQLTGLNASGLSKVTQLACGSNQLASLNVRGMTAMTVFTCNNNLLTSLDVSTCTALETVNCSNNRLPYLDVSKNQQLQVLDCSYNKLTGVDLSANSGMLSLSGSNQSPSRTMYYLSDVGKYVGMVSFNNPTGILSGLTYDNSAGTLSAPDQSIPSTPFTVETGCPQSLSSPYVSGTLSLTYSDDPPTYNPGDIAVINNAIDNNELSWSKAFPADGSYCPSDWLVDGTGVRWSDVYYNKRIIWLYVNNENLTGELDVTALSELEELLCHYNLLTGLKMSGLAKLRFVRCYANQLTELDLSGLTSVYDLACDQNQLTELDLSDMQSLRLFSCFENRMTELNISDCRLLEQLWCDQNELLELDVSRCPDLNLLWCEGNRLLSLDLHNNPGINSYAGLSQRPSRTLYQRPSDGKYVARIAMNNPTTLASGLTYSNGLLIADDNSIATTPFVVETGYTGSSTQTPSPSTLAGDLALTYESDNAAPILTADSVTHITDVRARLHFTSNEAGTYYLLVLPDEAVTPIPSEIIATYAGAVFQFSADIDSGAHVVEMTGLEPQTTYKAYIMMKDVAENSSAADELSFTTLAFVPVGMDAGASFVKSGITAGTTVYFGRFPQSVVTELNELTVNVDYIWDKGESFLIEPVAWRVLENAGGRLLLLAEQGLYGLPYYNHESSTTCWEDSEVRYWLNTRFLAMAFTATEQSAIVNVSVANANVSGAAQAATTDEVFLLSLDEARQSSYGFSTSLAASPTRLATVTDLAAWKGGTSMWWLRTTTADSLKAAVVNGSTGEIYTNLFSVATENVVMRPAIYVDASKVAFTSNALGAGVKNGVMVGSGMKAAAPSSPSVKLTALEPSTATLALTIDDTSPVTARPGDTLTFTYRDVVCGGVGTSVSLAVLGTSSSGAIDSVCYYGRLIDCSAGAGAASSGTLKVPLTFALMAGNYTLRFFEEQVNADGLTDYTSAPVDVPLDFTAEYTITYDYNGGAAPSNANPAKYLPSTSSSIVIPYYPTLSGYGFSGWAFTSDVATISPWVGLEIPAGVYGNLTALAMWDTVHVVVDSTFVYNGLAQCPDASDVKAYSGTSLLTQGADYTFTCSDNTDAGWAHITLTPGSSGRITGTPVDSFAILPLKLEGYWTVTPKPYHAGDRKATVVFTVTNNVIGDDVQVRADSAMFASPLVDSNVVVTIYNPLVLTGAKASNYSPPDTAIARGTIYPWRFIHAGRWTDGWCWDGYAQTTVLPISHNKLYISIEADCYFDEPLYGKGIDTLYVAAGKSFTMPPGSGLKIYHSIQLHSGSSFVNNGTLMSYTPSYCTYIDTLAAGRNWYLSSPVTKWDFATTFWPLGTPGGALTVTDYYVESSHAWQTISKTPASGVGMVLQSASAPLVVEFKGELSSADVKAPLTNTSTHAKQGFNLIGNPFPAFWRFNAAAVTAAGIYSTMWYRTCTPSLGYEFVAYNVNSSVTAAPGWSDASTAASLGFIPPMQAFWVRMLPGVASGRFVFDYASVAASGDGNRLRAAAFTELQDFSTELQNLQNLHIDDLQEDGGLTASLGVKPSIGDEASLRGTKQSHDESPSLRGTKQSHDESPSLRGTKQSHDESPSLRGTKQSHTSGQIASLQAAGQIASLQERLSVKPQARLSEETPPVIDVLVRIDIADADITDADQLVLYSTAAATPAFDDYDSEKMTDGADRVRLYTLSSNSIVPNNAIGTGFDYSGGGLGGGLGGVLTASLQVKPSIAAESPSLRGTKQSTAENDTGLLHSVRNDGAVTELCIDGRPQFKIGDAIPVVFWASQAGAFMLKASELRGCDTLAVYLIDNLANKQFRLNGGGVYYFSSRSGEITDRFTIEFRDAPDANEPVAEESEASFFAWCSAPGVITVRGATCEKIEVYDLAGRLISNGVLTGRGLTASLQVKPSITADASLRGTKQSHDESPSLRDTKQSQYESPSLRGTKQSQYESPSLRGTKQSQYESPSLRGTKQSTNGDTRLLHSVRNDGAVSDTSGQIASLQERLSVPPQASQSVTNLVPGIYIVRCAANSVKVVVR